jgi:capsular polysaccharide biosynthesis protein
LSLLKLSNAKIWNKPGSRNRYTLVSEDNRWVAGYNADLMDKKLRAGRSVAQYDDAARPDPRPSRYIHEESFLLIGSKNYYHWTLECLASIHLWRSFGDHRPKIVVGNLTQTQQDTLKAIGVPDASIIEVEDETNCHFRRVYVPSLTAIGNVDRICPEALIIPREIALQHRIEADGPPLIYISRRDAATRRLVNETELEEALIERGFVSVAAGELSFIEQVRFFAKARLVVALHGAGLTNLAYAAPGVSLIEIMPSFWKNPCFEKVTAIMGGAYASVLGEAVEFNGKTHLEVDVAEITRVVDEVLTFRSASGLPH